MSYIKENYSENDISYARAGEVIKVHGFVVRRFFAVQCVMKRPAQKSAA